MNLRLAEHKDGKFERFLELGSDNDDKFAFAGSSIILDAAECSCGCCKGPQHFSKDEKDPLNRFDGLFDGRTYGDGRFVLIKGFKYNGESYFEDSVYYNYSRDRNSVLKFSESGGFDFGIDSPCGAEEIIDYGVDLRGSLHENPELWEKVKNV